MSSSGKRFPSLGARGQRRYNTHLPAMTQTQKSRREVLERFAEQNPTDAFARYGLALECAKLGDNGAADGHFRRLLELHPNYVAGYQQYAQFLAGLERREEARKLLSDGIVIAQKAGDTHARDEMQSSLNLLR